MYIPTQAVQIQENNYSLAVACLNAGIVNVAKNDYSEIQGADGKSYVGLTNFWCSAEDFNQHYRFILGEIQNQLCDVERVE
jgi:hypothetical protein